MAEIHTSPDTLRQAARAGRHTGHTAGQAPGYIQGNVAILPRAFANDFERFCESNPKPCPLLARSAPGIPDLPGLGKGIDIRTDVPAYRVFLDGELAEEVHDIRHLWRDDLETFVLGCSFSFEEALLEAGLRLRHIDEGTNVPMYRTSIATNEAGPFGGPMVVSMRPFRPDDALLADEITGQFPHAHGSPIHCGDPAAIGIADLSRPDYGDPTMPRDGEIPVFWACGVTPQVAIERAKPELCITHAPGATLVTDLINRKVRR